MRSSFRLLQQALRKRSDTIGFIGLGAMGREMAHNLVSKTFANPKHKNVAFVVHDVDQLVVTRFLTAQTSLNPNRDVVTATSPAGVAALSSTVITMLPSSPHVHEVYLGEQGILAGVQGAGAEDFLAIDSTTLDPVVAMQAATAVQEAGGDMIDAPVSGGVVGARAATLSFMCGGSETAFKRAEPILATMGKRSVYCGKNTNGLIAKIANNLLLGISMLGVSEAMMLGVSNGLPPKLLADIINTSTGRCWSSEVNNPVPGALAGQQSPPADRGYEGGFASKLMAKDLSLALRAARLEGVPTPLGSLASSIYEALGSNDNFAKRDFAVAYEALSSAVGRPEFKDEDGMTDPESGPAPDQEAEQTDGYAWASDGKRSRKR